MRLLKSIITILFTLIVGVVIGFYLSTIFIDKDSATVKKNNKPAETPSESFTLINPVALSSDYKSRYYDEMSGFKKDVIYIIDSIMSNMKGYELSFYFFDLTNHISVGYNETLKFTPASLMKVPILIALLKEAEKDPGILQDRIIYKEINSPAAINKDEFKFKEGSNYSLEQLAEIMIQYSDNRAAIMIIEKIGLEKVKKVEEDLLLGTENSFDDKRSIGVKKYATVFKTLYNASYLSPEMSERALIILSQSRYGYGIRKSIPSEILVAQKFGIRENITINNHPGTIDQLHHFGIVYRPEKPYLIGIMMKGDNEKFMKSTISHITKHVDEEIQNRIKDIDASGIPSDAR